MSLFAWNVNDSDGDHVSSSNSRRALSNSNGKFPKVDWSSYPSIRCFPVSFSNKLNLNSNPKFGSVEPLVVGEITFAARPNSWPYRRRSPWPSWDSVEKCGDQMMCKDKIPRNLWADDDCDRCFWGSVTVASRLNYFWCGTQVYDVDGNRTARFLIYCQDSERPIKWSPRIVVDWRMDCPPDKIVTHGRVGSN